MSTCEIVLGSVPQNTFENKSPLVQVRAWCRQATRRYLIQCWPSSISSYGVTETQRFKYLYNLKAIDVWTVASAEIIPLYGPNTGFTIKHRHHISVFLNTTAFEQQFINTCHIYQHYEVVYIWAGFSGTIFVTGEMYSVRIEAVPSINNSFKVENVKPVLRSVPSQSLKISL